MSGIRKRRTGDSGSQGGPGMLKLYSDQTPGIKMFVLRHPCDYAIVIDCAVRLPSGPTSVLVLSLLFIGLVVALHIWGKFRRA
ncbi:hypothetical protein PBRA_008028 [Plasmodiophora brassicae]|uniref:Protein transport protein Sec61 subunit beta n=1 Tax=Plasmodiophora brassicae TaxID=37360 RepID=A0A0G4IYW1_PLABS|nr:hypothetical protein PBRA_008028 [Plasmodiophora brassicae]